LQDNGTGTAEALAGLQARIAAAHYTVLVYEPAALPGPHAALLIEALNRIVKAANGTVRAGCLALGGDDGALTVNQTVAWLSGLPLRTRVSTPARTAGTAPLDHDPYRYRAARLLADGEIDALLWVASFAPPAWPQALDPDVPAIVLGHPALAEAAKARGASTIFIPVATPGIDSGGHLFRVDSSVVMPLTAARGATLPSVATIAERLSERLSVQLAAHLNAHPATQVQP
jgi:formylmethanofuran dehydrogenase subunit B